MRAWDSVTQGGSLRPGPAALTILLIGLLLSLAPVSRQIETGYYDFLATLRRSPGSPEVVIVDTRAVAAIGATAWESPRFPDLLIALREAGARLVVAAEPPPLGAAVPETAQLAALEAMEQRRRDSAGGKPSAAFAEQISAMRAQAELHRRTVTAVAAMRNLIAAVPTFDGGRATPAERGSCTKPSLDLVPQAVDPQGMRRVRAVATPADDLCAALLAIGHGEFWADDDGTVRRIDLLIDAAGTTVPAAALRAVMALSYPGSGQLGVTGDGLSWDEHRLSTTDGTKSLLNFYAGDEGQPAFRVVPAADVLARSVATPLAGHIVVIGPATGRDGEPAYQSPLGAHTTGAQLVATAISNALQKDFVARPAWTAWGEIVLLVGLGVAVLVWGVRMAPTRGLAVGLSLALALLGVEAYLLLAMDLWLECATAAVFCVLALMSTWFVRTSRWQQPALQPALAGAGAPMPASAAAHPEDELDLAFSMLRHQPATDQVKQRLYDIAVEHARRRDLAKAERVLRHLAGVDPDYRNAGDKLQKLAGMRRSGGDRSAPAQVPPVVVPTVQPESLSGQTIGRYQIEQPIGRGAMATVYLGRDPKINRRVAIKTIALAEEFSDSDLANARTQFLREAESAGRLNHPNIISIYDAGEDGAVAYLAMEFFPGKPLSHYAQPGQMLPPAKVFELMARAAEALHYAHAQHVVHRDVKPANLLYDIDSDTLKITDFGIARLTDSSRTKTGIILGTPSYMSPEQLAGTTVAGQSDLFSLGITLYQLLAGAPPFRADSIPRLMQKIAHERHPRISELRDDLPPCVDDLLDRALAKDPADRYESGRAMALALRDCCSSLDAPPATGAS
ncbi:MAG: protein kinase [Gammaproteobacteria bacterium]|nr:protein kinase [Gammaproteobacteria bacterium]